MAKSNTKANNDQNDPIEIVEVKGSNLSVSNILEKYQNIISYVLLGIGLLIALFFVYKYLYQGPREKEAANLMYKSEELFARDSFALALDNPGGDFVGFLGIIDEYSGTKAANLAKLYAGISYLNLGKFEEAIDYLNDYSAKDPATTITKYGTLADAHSELGDMAKAIDLYKKASKSDNEFLASYYNYKLAMAYMNEGKEDEAYKLFALIKSKYPDAAEINDVDKWLARKG